MKKVTIIGLGGAGINFLNSLKKKELDNLDLKLLPLEDENIDKNLIELYADSFKNNWDLKGLSDYSEKKTLYYKDIAREIARIHILLNEAQVKKGDKIALIGKNNIPWCVTYLAVLTYGGVIVPIYKTFTRIVYST